MASFSERYHEFSKYNPLSIDRLSQVDWSSEPRPFKSELVQASLDLTPWLQHLTSMDPNHTHQEFGPSSAAHVCSPEFLASLFFHAGGITAAMQTEKGPFYFRSNPSAGGIYPNESYLIPVKDFSVDDKTFGKGEAYHFQPLNNQLFQCPHSIPTEQLDEIFKLHPSVEYIILITTIHSRGVWRYGDRAYRRELLDAGHLAANFKLYADTKQKSIQWMGGFQENTLKEALQLEQEEPIFALGVSNTTDLNEEVPLSGRSLEPLQAFEKIDHSLSIPNQQYAMEAQFETWDLPLPPTHLSEIETQEYKPLEKHNIGNLNAIPIDMVRRRSTRNFNPKLERQGLFEKFSQMVDFALDHHPNPNSGPFLKTWLLFKGDAQIEPSIYLLEPQKKLWQKYPKTLNWEELQQAALGQDIVLDTSVTIFHTANLASAVEYYGDRAYRYLTLDAGIYGQLMQIAAGHLGYGTTGIGGYFDDLCNEIIDQPLTEAIIYMTLIGTPED